MKDVIIVNLTRMGDLLQTTPVIAGLKEKYPAVRITLLVSPAFFEICNYIPYVDRVLTFDGKKVIESLNNDDFISGFRYVEDSLRTVNDTVYDVAINLTHSTASAFLLSLINAKEIRGYTVDAEGHSVIKHPWMRYFFNIVTSRQCNPFHICDLHVKIGGAVPAKKGLHLVVPEDAEQSVNDVLLKHGVGEGDILIGLQLGASREDRRWPVSSFAELADRLTDEFGAKILLTGSSKEAELGKKFEDIVRTKPLNFIGKTSLVELASLLKRCNLFISNDTGPMHIATAVGTKVIGIFLVTALFRETGPYGEGHYAVQADIPCSPCSFRVKCSEMICKDAISADKVFELTRRIMLNTDVLQIEPSSMWDGVQIYRSYFAEDGFLDYYPLIKRPLNNKTLFSYLYRQTWVRILDGDSELTPEELYQSIVDKINLRHNSIEAAVQLDEELNALRSLIGLTEMGLSLVTLIAKEAVRPSPDVKRIKELWKRVPDIEEEIEKIGYSHSLLSPLTFLFKYGKGSIEDEDLASQAEQIRLLYTDLLNHTKIIMQTIEQLMSLHASKEEAGKMTKDSVNEYHKQEIPRR
jgi:ADP-heptose:LPS heptosyltransferase